MSSLKLVTLDNAHELIPQYISEKKLMIGSYEDMMNVVLSMIRDKYFFNMDKNILRGCLEDLTYMFTPGDDVNKDRVVAMLEPSDSESEDDDESNDGGESMEQFQEMMMRQLSSQMGGMDMGKMMEQMGGQPEEQQADNSEEPGKCSDCPKKECDNCPKKEQEKQDEVGEVEEVTTEGSAELTKEEGAE